MSTNSDEYDKISLEENLKEIDIKNLSDLNIEYLHFSPVDEEKNRKAYNFVNKRLIEIIDEKETGEYIHITGEMKALADPNHRKCIKNLYTHNKQQFKIVFSLPKGFKMNGFDIKRYNIETWRTANWVDHLDAFDILGENKVKIYNKYERELIQYSLFGDSLILFQSKHEPRQYIKKVWILESKDLFKKLQSHFKDILGRSHYIEPINFSRFNLSLSSNSTLHILSLLNRKERIRKREIHQELKRVAFFDKIKIEYLILIGFIKEFEDFFQLTKSGIDFLRLFN